MNKQAGIIGPNKSNIAFWVMLLLSLLICIQSITLQIRLHELDIEVVKLVKLNEKYEIFIKQFSGINALPPL